MNAIDILNILLPLYCEVLGQEDGEERARNAAGGITAWQPDDGTLSECLFESLCIVRRTRDIDMSVLAELGEKAAEALRKAGFEDRP